MAEPTAPKNNTDAKDPKKDAEAAKAADKKPSEPAKADAKKADAKPSGKSSSVPPSGTGAPDAKSASSGGGGGGRAFLVVVLLIAIIAGGGYVTRDVWSPIVAPYLEKFAPGAKTDGDVAQAPDQAKPPSVEDRLADLERRMENEESVEMQALKQEGAKVRAELSQALQRIDDLERRLLEVRDVASALTSSSVGGGADLSAVMDRIDGLEARRKADADEIAQLTQRLSTVVASGSGSAGQGLVLALAQLRDAALSGRPYAAQLNALRRVAGENTEMVAAAGRLSPRADVGLPTPAALESAFSGLAGQIVVKANAASDDWLDQTTAKLASLIALRRTDGQSGDPVEDAIATIEKQLGARTLEDAVNTAEALADSLPAQARETLEPWLLDLKARVGAERALDAMQSAALAALDNN